MNSIKDSRAILIYKELCKKIDENGWKSVKDDEALLVNFKAKGKDEPMTFSVFVDVENKLVKLLSYINVIVPESKRKEVALAVCHINNRIIDGNFDYNHKTGNLFFRMTNSYGSTEFSSSVLDYMLECSTYVVDKYDTLLKGMVEGIMNLEEFLIVAFSGSGEEEKETFEKKSKAVEMYDTIRRYVVENGVEISDVGNMTMKFSVVGEDIEMPFVVSIDSYRELIKLHSPMPFSISKEKSLECALAVCDANFGMSDGCFEFDAEAGFLEFRTEISYSNGAVSEKLLEYLLNVSCEIVDKYNHRFLIFGV